MIGRPRLCARNDRALRTTTAFVAGLSLISVLLSGCAGNANPSASATPSGPAAVSPSDTQTMSPPSSPTAASWSQIASPPWIEGNAVWDGHEVLVVHTGYTWDKQAGVGHCDEVAAAYAPSTDTWRMLPPIPRITQKQCEWGAASDAIIWTGTEMLLWGATNSAYDPATNTWHRLTAAPTDGLAPQATVWTGRQMLGFGTLDCCDVSDTDGVSFTPATGIARSLPPSPLRGGAGPMAVWTGTEMIVAGGGYEGGYVYNDVASYRPETGNWRSLAPMPVSRIHGTALWDGTELLVFGGEGGSTTESGTNPNLRVHPLARGAAYDPATNRWRWLPAPAFPRVGAVYAWDGREVLMWGGIGIDRSIPPHGEAFDPATNSWSPIPAAPLRARVWPNAVWTDRSWILWGGIDARHWAATWDSKPLSGGAGFTPGSP